jgi:predicted alpha/beta-hydrolase family hydrolase
MASMIADQQNVSGLICLGYPFYAPGKKDKPRIDHLQNLMTKTLILQGERDAMGSREIVETYKISNKISISWSPDGDHSLKPRKKSGFTEKDNFRSAFKSISQFIE